jgi:hypothetical protein
VLLAFTAVDVTVVVTAAAAAKGWLYKTVSQTEYELWEDAVIENTVTRVITIIAGSVCEQNEELIIELEDAVVCREVM